MEDELPIPDGCLRVLDVFLIFVLAGCLPRDPEPGFLQVQRQGALDILDLVLIGHLDGEQSVEFASLQEAGDKTITVDIRETLLVLRRDVRNGIELGHVVCNKLLVDDLDLDEEIDITFLYFRGVHICW